MTDQADDITSKVLLEHIQGNKYELQIQMKDLKDELQVQMKGLKDELKQEIGRIETKMDEGFQDAAEHRRVLQEDLEATIKMQGQHQEKLASMSA
tara:strand:+ start:96 stop:380 length:285 start_codon:yes stop_codon:yes gene_type:complete